MSDFKAKMHQIRFPLGLQRLPGNLTALPRPSVAVFKGPTSKRREGERKGKGGEGCPPPTSWGVWIRQCFMVLLMTVIMNCPVSYLNRSTLRLKTARYRTG